MYIYCFNGSFSYVTVTLSLSHNVTSDLMKKNPITYWKYHIPMNIKINILLTSATAKVEYKILGWRNNLRGISESIYNNIDQVCPQI